MYEHNASKTDAAEPRDENIDIQIPEKTLSILYYNGIPTFAFDGHWTGKDISVITRNIPVAYAKYNRGIRLGGKK